MELTTEDKIGLGRLGIDALGGLLGGLDDSAERRSDERFSQSRDDELFMLLLESLANQGRQEGDFRNEDLQRSLAFSSANPLGAEQRLRQNTVLGRAGLEALGGRQLARGTPNIAAGFMNRPGVSDALSDNAINESIRQRRIATAGIDPRASMEIGGTGNYAQNLFNDIQNSRNAQRTSSGNIQDQINSRRAMIQQQMAQQDQGSGGPGFWRKLGGTLLPIAGVAANFIPGVGPVLGTILSGAAGAGGGALAGGRRGAILGGIGGTAAGIGLNRAGLGNSVGGRTFNNSMTPASLPIGNMVSARTNPLLQGIQGLGQHAFDQFGSTFGGSLPRTVGQNRPNISSTMPVGRRSTSSFGGGQPYGGGASGSWSPNSSTVRYNNTGIVNPPVRPGPDDVRMVSPQGHTALARPEHVSILTQMGWTPLAQ